jgi:hypothetical protein
VPTSGWKVTADPVPSAAVPAQQVSPVLLALIAGGFTLLGVLLKIGDDSLAARRASKSEAVARFAPERRDAYEKFLALVQRQRDYDKALHALAEAHRRGDDVPDERLETFPPSPMQELVEALRVGRSTPRTPVRRTSGPADSVIHTGSRILVDGHDGVGHGSRPRRCRVLSGLAPVC